MSSIVFQGLQSCLEPRLIEPLVRWHKLSPPKTNSSQSFPQQPSPSREQESSHNKHENINKDGYFGGWSFAQSLTNTPQNYKEVAENEKVYVHPLVKRSSSVLSEKSLEMCTESLGSETGSDISENDLMKNDDLSRAIQPSSKSRELTKKLSRSGRFPPPLTSISCSDCVQVRPHREGGRLVIKAVTVVSNNKYFQAERVDGRLKLSLLKENYMNCDNEEVDEGVVEEHVISTVGENKGAGEYYDDDDDDDDKGVEGIGGSSGKEGGGEFARPSRCKEGGGENKGICLVGDHSGWPLLKALC